MVPNKSLEEYRSIMITIEMIQNIVKIQINLNNKSSNNTRQLSVIEKSKTKTIKHTQRNTNNGCAKTQTKK